MKELTVTGGGGVRLAVRVHGAALDDAPGLLLHHGLASSQHIWDLMLPRLAATFRVVTYDARGHSRSGKPTSGYGFDHVVADAGSVMRATGLRAPVVAVIPGARWWRWSWRHRIRAHPQAWCWWTEGSFRCDRARIGRASSESSRRLISRGCRRRSSAA